MMVCQKTSKLSSTTTHAARRSAAVPTTYAAMMQHSSARDIESRTTTLEEFEEFFGAPLSPNKKRQEETSRMPAYEECPFDSFFHGTVNARCIAKSHREDFLGAPTAQSNGNRLRNLL